MNKKMYAAVLALPFVWPVYARSAEPVFAMDEVVVTATKTEEKTRDVPYALVIRNALDLAESPIQSLGGLLANEPGIDWRTRGDYGGAAEEIQIRGMGGDATQVFFNGININSPSLGSADVGRLPLNTIEKIEVVKGPGSLLYGTGAMAGTVNLITKSPQRDKLDLKLGSGLGSEGAYELSAEQGMYLSRNFGYYLTATRRETNGFRENSELKHHDVSAKLVCDLGEALQANLFGAYIDREYGVPGVRPPAGTQDYFVGGVKMYDAEASSLVNKGSDQDLYSALELKSRPLDWLSLTLRGDAVNMENYYYRRNNGALWPKAAGEGDETWVTNEALGLEGIAEMRLPHGITVLLGSQYKDYHYKNEVGGLDANGVGVSGSRATDSHDVFTRGAYIETQYRPNQYLKLLAGLRHEQHSMFGYEDLPRFGAVISPAEGTTLKLGRGRHFKAPTMNDLYWPDDGWVRGNPALQPETGWHSDVNLEQALLNNKVVVSASYFVWNIDNKIDWAENPAFPTAIPGFDYWTPSNVNDYEAKGWELGLQLKPMAAMRLGLSYTRTNAEEQKSPGIWRQSQYTPKNLAKAEASYLFDFGLTAAAIVRYVDERPAYYATNAATIPLYTLDSYVTADIKLSQRLREHWLLAVQMNNIFDEGYDTYMASFRNEATATTTRQGYPGAGRSAFMSVSYEF